MPRCCGPGLGVGVAALLLPARGDLGALGPGSPHQGPQSTASPNRRCLCRCLCPAPSAAAAPPLPPGPGRALALAHGEALLLLLVAAHLVRNLCGPREAAAAAPRARLPLAAVLCGAAGPRSESPRLSWSSRRVLRKALRARTAPGGHRRAAPGSSLRSEESDLLT